MRATKKTASGLPSDGIQVGYELAHPPPGEEIVVSGLAGKFPDSDDARQFRENLFNKVDLVSDDERRWVKFHDEIPQRTGKINGVDSLDVGYFGLRSTEANCLDPMVRLMLEKTVEAVVDAGINPCSLAGSNTGVYVGICASETEKDIVFDNKFFKGETLLGCIRNQAAQRISYHLQLNGPSFISDTACSSSAYALELAYRELRMGKCDQAIVGGVNLCLLGTMSLQFARLGMLSPEGILRAFDEDANGYVRSEAVCAVLLQKAKDAKRIYCKIVHAKVNSDGYKSEGITYPSGVFQARFLDAFYKECAVCPSTVSFLEAHGTGTKVGDPEEVFAIASIFCKDRREPLLLGSIKSNIGHSEPTSGLCSLAKVVFAMETGYIPPNINFKTPKREILALHDGRISVVTEKTPWNDDLRLSAVNNFGFGGANCHFLLAPNEKSKNFGGLPPDDLPRLVCVSGRTKEAVSAFLDDLKDRDLDAEYVRLFHEIFSGDMPNENYRGFTIIDKRGELNRSMRPHSKPNQICLVFGDVEDENWGNIGKDLVAIPIFANTIEKIQSTLGQLEARGVITAGRKAKEEEEPIKAIATQIALFEVIREIGIEPDYLMGMGNNLGELACAYYDGLLPLEQLLTAAYHMGSSKFNPVFFQSMKVNAASGRPKKWIRDWALETQVLAEEDQNTMLYFGPKTPTRGDPLRLINSGEANAFFSLLSTLGRLYEKGVNLDLWKLYPEVKWPVSRGTPMISPLIKWEYNHRWYVAQGSWQKSSKSSGVFVVNTKYNDWAYLEGHVIDGSTLFPAAGYLYLIWDFVSEKTWTTLETYNVVFENVRFLRASKISRQQQISYNISVKSNGEFEITEKDVLLVTGSVTQIEKTNHSFTDLKDLSFPDDDVNRMPLSQKDVYKELRLRGYNYTGGFRGIQTCNNLANKAAIKWDGNWITFIDSMLQMNILQADTRNLYIPTGIGKLLINWKKQEAHIRDDGTVDVYCSKEANLTTSGGVEIVGLCVNQISRRKILAQPVLESYEFVPNEGVLDLDQCVRVNMQIILEDSQERSFKMVEVLHGQTKEPLCRTIQKVLADQPLIQPEIKLLSNEPLELADVITENEPLSNNSNCLLVVGVDLLGDDELLRQAKGAIIDNGYIITRQDLDYKFERKPGNLVLTTCYRTQLESIILLKKYTYKQPAEVLNIADPIADLSWISKLQQIREDHSEIVVVSQNIECNGVLGFVNCLRREPNGTKFRCALLLDDVAKFDINEAFYEEQMKKGMALNVFKDGRWGTYRHLLIDASGEKESESAYLSVINPGDLSSLKWVEGSLTEGSVVEQDKVFVKIYYSALNFRDILTASGRLPMNIGEKTRVLREGFPGMELAGRDPSGKRVFGMTQRGGLSTLFTTDSHLLWNIPDEWSMEEAVTVPVVYVTVLYAFVIAANIRRGQTVLIHSGSGGVGQAAINVALHHGCTVFTTVGTKEKKAFILKQFPQIKEEHVGNSRDTTFEQMVLEQTQGRGVDIALNSLVQDKLHATVRCVAKGGYYLEIGKADLVDNEKLSLLFFERGIKAAGVMLDLVFAVERKERITELMMRHIESGAVKPLHRFIYNYEDIEAAYRFMATGKHMGKVVIKIREEENSSSLPKQLFKCKPMFYCNPSSTYVIIGGLGGVGMELADWLIVKGCRNLVLASRRDLKTGYQALRMRFWQKYEAVIYVFTEDVTTRDGCRRLLAKASEFGQVDGVFNLAVDLKDALFDNQSVENFLASLKPKAIATHHLDVITRQLYPCLRYFVVFSSVSAGRGNQGQTNYGLANSIMENICEKRRFDGFPALAIQWGAIGDVGLVADMNELNRDVVIGGTLPQRISNCLEVLERFLHQDKAVVSSMVVAEKMLGGNIEEIICNILGIKNVETVNQQSSFPELGMDSITGLEIKQVIEGQFDVMLTPQEMKSMTFLKLKELSQNKSIESTPGAEPQDWLSFLLRYVTQTDLSCIPSVETGCENKRQLPEVSFLPGIDGMSIALQPLTSKLQCRANVCQFLYNYRNDDIQSLAEEVTKYIKQNNSSFNLVAYSFGCLVALEAIALLERQGSIGRVIFIDGSVKQFKSLVKGAFPMQDEEAAKTHLLMKMLQSTSFVFTKELEAKLAACKTTEEKIQYVTTNTTTNRAYSPKYLRDSFRVTYDRIRAVSNYECSFQKLRSRVMLLRPKIGGGGDQGLSDLFENPVVIKMFEEDHESILKNDQVAKEINDFICES